MHFLSSKHLVVAATLLAAPLGNMMYPRATISNRTLFPANVEVRYAACKSDKFTVPAGRPAGDTVVAGIATATSNRGMCLITGVTATLTGSTQAVNRYTSTGTSYSKFILLAAPTWRIMSDHEYAAFVKAGHK